jgi:hypothetical protein
LSSSKLFDTEVPEGVLDPVLVGDCIGESLFEEGATSTALALALSPPVMASDIALRPAVRDFLLKNEFECEVAAGDGEARPVDDVSLPGRAGEFAMASILGVS